MTQTFSIWLQTVDAGFTAWETASIGLLFVRWVVCHWPRRAQCETFGEITWTKTSS